MTEAEQEFYDERAAIREYDGKLPRHEAEQGALEDIARRATEKAQERPQS